MTSNSEPKARRTKDQAGAILAATTAFLFISDPAHETANHLHYEYAHVVAALVSLALALLAYWVGLRAMRKLP
ncbi:hypothetical protein ABZ636_38295 [Streptomyces sp. NPDC007251]|uniref:hypothetical protein n=1 Tax=unclassified Streptomyces TaxID=2593676 RepID=UPI0033D4A601